MVRLLLSRCGAIQQLSSFWLRAGALLDSDGMRTPGADCPNVFPNGVVDRQRIKHVTLMADDAVMLHPKQRFIDYFGRNRSGTFLLLDHGEKLKVARRASARERARDRSMRHHANKDRCEHPCYWAEFPRHPILLSNSNTR